MSVVIEVAKIKSIKVGGEWINVGKAASVVDSDCEFEDEDHDTVASFEGGVIAFDGADSEDYVVPLNEVQAFRLR